VSDARSKAHWTGTGGGRGRDVEWCERMWSDVEVCGVRGEGSRGISHRLSLFSPKLIFCRQSREKKRAKFSFIHPSEWGDSHSSQTWFMLRRETARKRCLNLCHLFYQQHRLIWGLDHSICWLEIQFVVFLSWWRNSTNQVVMNSNAIHWFRNKMLVFPFYELSNSTNPHSIK
jgi:hypothetical protein